MPVESSASSDVRHESIVEVLWRRKQMVLTVFGIVMVAAAVLLKVTPKRATAEGRVEVARNLPKNADPATVDQPTFMNTQAVVVQSAPVLGLAMGGPDMESLSLFAGQDNPITVLKDRLDVRPMPGTQILQVRLTGTNDEEDKQVVSAVCEAYVAHIAEQKRNSALTQYQQIGQDRARVDEQRLQDKKYLASLQAETAPYAGDASGNLALQRLKDISGKLTAAKLDLVNLRSQYEESLKAVNMTPDKPDADRLASATVVGPEMLPVLQDNLKAMSQQLIEAKRQLLPSSPIVRNVQNQIKDMRLSQAATLQTMVATAVQKQAATEELYGQAEKSAQEANAKLAELAMMTDRVKGLDQQVAVFDGKLQQLNLTESVGIEAREADDVTVDPNSAVPNSKKALGLAALIGLATGMMAALVREWVSPSLGAVHRIADTVGIPLLGTLPRVTGRSSTDLARLTYDGGDGEAAEAFRSVRTSLLFGADPCQTIAITSPTTGDGKTTLATNLAILLAQSGKRVALVDADFRQPALHEIFGLDNPVGLSGVLNGDDVDTAVRRTPVEHLDVLTAGPRSGETSQQLNSPRFNEVLRELKSRYDHVLFDTAGVIGSNDARVIASGCDTTVLVMRDERTTRFAATTARDALLSVGAMLLGIVLNDAARNGPAFPAGPQRRPAAAPTPATVRRSRTRR